MLHPKVDLHESVVTPAFLASVFWVCLQDKKGPTRGQLSVRSVKKAPHARLFASVEECAEARRVPKWFRRMTGREIVCSLPPEHGVNVTSGGVDTVVPPVEVDRWREPARALVMPLRDDPGLTASLLDSFSPPNEHAEIDFNVMEDLLLEALRECSRSESEDGRVRLVINLAGSRSQGFIVDADGGGAPVSRVVSDRALAWRSELSHPLGPWVAVDAFHEVRDGAVVTMGNHCVRYEEPEWDLGRAGMSWQEYCGAVAEDVRRFPRPDAWTPDWVRLRRAEAEGEFDV